MCRRQRYRHASLSPAILFHPFRETQLQDPQGPKITSTMIRAPIYLEFQNAVQVKQWRGGTVVKANRSESTLLQGPGKFSPRRPHLLVKCGFRAVLREKGAGSPSVVNGSERVSMPVGNGQIASAQGGGARYFAVQSRMH